MKLRYLDGTEDDDSLFDRSDDEQAAMVARMMGLRPDPDYWPEDVIQNLLSVRRLEGKAKFHTELRSMMTPGGR